MRILGSILAGLACTTVVIAGCSSAKTAQVKSTKVTLQVSASASWPKSSAARLALMKKAKDVTQRRLTGYTGLDSADVTVKDDDKLVVVLRGMTGPQEVASAVAQVSSLADIEFYYLDNIRSRYNPMGEWQLDEDKSSYRFTGANGRVIDSVKQPSELMSAVVDPKRRKPILTGLDIMPNAKAQLNQASMPVIEIEFNKNGAKVFHEFTLRHVHDYLAVFYGKKLLTAPTISEPITAGKAEITGFATLKEARDTANVINSGAQVVPLKVIKQEIVNTP